LEEILTYQGLKLPQSPSIHMDWGRTEQALVGFCGVADLAFPGLDVCMCGYTQRKRRTTPVQRNPKLKSVLARNFNWLSLV
jgi:hypothetical protein